MLRRVVLFLILPLALTASIPLSASAADCTVPGTRPATADDAVVKAGQLQIGTCYNPSDQGVSQSAEEAKNYLRSIFTGNGTNGCSAKTGDTDKIGGLNPSFAVCAAKFLQAVRQQDPTIKVVSAYRTADQQTCMCGSGSSGCAAGGRSNHQLGIAVDLNARNYGWLHQQIDRFPGLRYLTIANDPYHMEAIKGGPCMAPGYMPPNFTADPVASSMPFDSSVRRALGVPPPPPPPPPAPQTSPVQTIQQPTQQGQTQTGSTATPPSIDTLNSTAYPPGTCTPQTYCSQSDGNIYYRATTCVDQKYQACANGCTGLICNASSTSATNSQLSGLLTPTGTNGDTSSPSTANSSSTFDLINFFANPTAAIAANVGTATPIDISQLIQDTGNASVLQPVAATTGQPIQTPPQGSTSGYGPVPQQTFTSPDLANAPGTYYAPQSSTFQTSLANMKATLIGILHYLQPFGGRIEGTQVYGE